MEYLDDGRFIVAIEWESSDVARVGEEEGGVAVVGFAAGGVVAILAVAQMALAFERSFLVGAQLRAAARHQTLVHVCN